MSITREEAIQEAKRRGLIAQDFGSKPKITREQAIQEARRRGLIPNEEQIKEQHLQKEHPFLHKTAKWLTEHPSIGKPVNYLGQSFEKSGWPDFFGSAVESAGNVPLSIGNVPLSVASELSGKNMRVPMFNSGYKPGLASTAGDILGTGAGMAATFGSLGAAGPLSRTAGFPGYLNQILKGGATGYLGGASREGEGELTDFGRMLSGGLGAAGTAVGSGLSRSTNAFNNLRSHNIANRIMADRTRLRGEFNRDYNNLWEGAREAGINQVPIPRMNRARILRNLNRNEAESINNLFENPTIENMHWAKSDLGKKINQLIKTPNLTSSRMAGLRDMQRAHERLENTITKTFNKSRNPSLSDAYEDITARYGRDMMPYETKLMKEYANPKHGRPRGMTDRDFVKSLRHNKEFKNTLSEMYPEVNRQNIAEKIGLGTALAVGGGAIPGSYYLTRYGVQSLFE